ESETETEQSESESETETEQSESETEQTESETETSSYDVIATTSSTYTSTNPRFKYESNNSLLESNLVEFKLASSLETVYWQYADLSSYQKAIITFKNSQDSGSDSVRFKFVKRSTSRNYYRETKTVTATSSTYEVLIPQGIAMDCIGIENSWDDSSNNWSSDFSFYVEKIELIKDASLINEEFNQLTESAAGATIVNPPLQDLYNTTANENTACFEATKGQEYYGNGWSACYWEFEDLAEYTTVKLTVHAENPNNNSQTLKFSVNGYVPADYPNSFDGAQGRASQSYSFASANTSLEMSLSVDSLKTGLGENTLTAIAFQNQTYTGEWVNGSDENLDYGPSWYIVVDEIVLEK
nr:hypothetical protein [Treponema sp.]